MPGVASPHGRIRTRTPEPDHETTGGPDDRQEEETDARTNRRRGHRRKAIWETREGGHAAGGRDAEAQRAGTRGLAR